MLPGALAIVVLGFTASIGAMKLAAEKTGERIDPDRELLAIGLSNVGAGLTGGYAVCGALSKTAVAIESRGKTQIGNLFAGVLGVLTILFLLPLFADLASGTLAAIIVVAIMGLSDLPYFRRLWHVRRLEFAVAVLVVAAVLLFGVMAGVMVGVGLALFIIGERLHSPRTSVVGRLPTGAFVDIQDHKEAREIPGMLIWRQYAPLVFLNARTLSNRLRERALDRADLRVVALDATASAGLDSTATAAFLGVQNDLHAAGIALWVVNIQEDTWQQLVATLRTGGGPIPRRFDSLDEAVARFEHERPQAP
jgi:MFS superfamily sulfate permease-like transporter